MEELLKHLLGDGKRWETKSGKVVYIDHYGEGFQVFTEHDDIHVLVDADLAELAAWLKENR